MDDDGARGLERIVGRVVHLEARPSWPCFCLLHVVVPVIWLSIVIAVIHLGLNGSVEMLDDCYS